MFATPPSRVEKVERQDFDKRRNTKADRRSAAAGQLRHSVVQPPQDVANLELVIPFTLLLF